LTAPLTKTEPASIEAARSSPRAGRRSTGWRQPKWDWLASSIAMGGVLRPGHRATGRRSPRRSRHAGSTPRGRWGRRTSPSLKALAAGREPRSGRQVRCTWSSRSEQVLARHGPHVGRALQGIADLQFLHAADELLLEAVGDGSSTMKRLAAMQLWPELMVRAWPPGAPPRGIGVVEDNEGSEPPSSRTVFLRHRPPPRHLPPRLVAAGERHRLDHGWRISSAVRVEGTRRWSSPLGAARLVNRASMASAVPGRSRRASGGRRCPPSSPAREAEDLPEGEVPGHDGEHRPQWLIAHETLPASVATVCSARKPSACSA